MSSLRTVQNEIEKALAATLRTRFIAECDNGTIDCSKFDERDLEKLRRTDYEGELYVRLFIRSRQGDLEKANKMMMASLAWRKKIKVRDIDEAWFEEEKVKAMLQEGILFYHNTDKNKNPILIFQGNKYKYKNQDDNVKNLEKLFAFVLEKQHQQHFGKQVLVICDHQNATLENIDLEFFKFVVNLFDVYYPYMLESFLVIGVSWRVSSAWKNIQKWFSPAITPKFNFIEKERLVDFVDKEKLLRSMGGRDGYKYEYPHVEGTQNPLEPFIDGNGDSSDLDAHSNFEDAVPIEQKGVSEPIYLEELSEESLTEESVGGSKGSLRKRKSRMGEAPFLNEEIFENELIVSPCEDIIFQEIEGANELIQTLTLKNNSAKQLLFKIKTNSAANFRVKPSVGAVEPDSLKEVTVMLLLKGEAIQEKHDWSKDKFLILYAEHSDDITPETNYNDLWKNIPNAEIKEYKLNCRLLDVYGWEKRPRTIDDAIEMNQKLQQQILQLQGKMENFSDPLTDIKEQLKQQKLLLVVMSLVIVTLFLVFYFFR